MQTGIASDAYDVLSPREADASRALKSALIGLFILPLQIYTGWLLFLVVVSDEPLRPRYFWYALVAAVIMIPDVLLSSGLLVVLLLSPASLHGPLPPP